MVSSKGPNGKSAAKRRRTKGLAKRLTAAQAAGIRGGGKKRADGTGGGTVVGGWDVVANKKF